MNVLVIDDLRTFAFEATYARTAEEAIPYLRRLPDPLAPEIWDEVWWDHDLGGSDVWPVVETLERQWHDHPETKDHVKLHCVVTDNPVGATALMRTFEHWDVPYRDVRGTPCRVDWEAHRA